LRRWKIDKLLRRWEIDKLLRRWEIGLDRRMEPTTKQRYITPFPLAKKTKNNRTKHYMPPLPALARKTKKNLIHDQALYVPH
jgi:hypothetical protein